MTERKYNLIPSGNDSRDFLYCNVKAVNEVLPPKFSNKVNLIFDQGVAGTCGWNAIVYAMMVDNNKYNYKKVLSRLYGYALTKKSDGIAGEGIRIRDGLDIAVKKGTCLEALYPYSDSEDVINLKFPPMNEQMDTDARVNKASAYARLYKLKECKNAVIKEGGFVIGVTVTDQLLKGEKNGGVIGRCLGSILGGHAMYVTGYDDTLKTKVTYDDGLGYKETVEYTGAFYGPNSWGEDWGDKGYFYIPYACFDLEKIQDFYFNLVKEAWTITEVPKEVQPISTIEMKIGSNQATIKGKPVTLDCPPEIKNGRTLVPLRFIAEALGKEVIYDNRTQTIIIDGVE